jgi:hypothetical protein
MTGVTEEQWVAHSRRESRLQAGLPGNATSESVYRNTAQFTAQTFSQFSPELQRETMTMLGLKRSEMTNQSKVFDALINLDRKETGVPATATLDQLENAKHRQEYKTLARTGKMPIDCD